MSKISPKQRYIQLSDWLTTFKKRPVKTSKSKRESRMDHYKKQGIR